MNSKFYRSSGKFSWSGIILVILTFVIVGGGLSWLYLLINRHCPSVYLCILAVVALSFGVGTIAKIFVKKFKIRSVPAVLLGTIIGLLLMNYVKWATYDYYDIKSIIEDAQDYLEGENAYTYFQMDIDFDESYSFDENYDFLTTTNAFDYYQLSSTYDGEDYLAEFSDSQIAEMKEETLYEFYDYDKILGETKEECQVNVEKAKGESAYDMVADADGMDIWEYFDIKDASFMEVLTSPADLWSDIKQINKEGRWSYSTSSTSSYSYNSSENKNDDAVNGGLLWIVWFGELMIICISSMGCTLSQAKKVFIEQDDDWGKELDGNQFCYATMPSSAVKSLLVQSTDNLTRMLPVRPQDVPHGQPYIKFTLTHSVDFSECYLNAYAMNFVQKQRKYGATKIFTGLCISPKNVGILFTMCGCSVPGRILSDVEFIEWQRYTANQQAQMSSVAATSTQPQAQVAVNGQQNAEINGSMQSAYEAWKQSKLAASQNTENAQGMDSISADDISKATSDDNNYNN